MNTKQFNGLAVRIGNFTPGDFTVPKEFLDTNLSAPAKLLYTVLATCSGGRDYAWPSQEYLAEKLKVHVRTIQRYLKELVDSGLIAKGKKFIKGQVRNIYHFLTKNGSDFFASPDTTNLSSRSVSGQKNLSPDTTNCSDQHDTPVAPYIDEELLREENKIPPTPAPVGALRRQDLSCSSVNSTRAETELPTPTLAAGGGDKNFAEEEKSEAPATLEAQEWTAAKKILAEKLSNGNFAAWIAPLIFEKSETGAILRAPNKFFQSWLSEHYGQELSEALKLVEIFSFKFELMTGAQQEKFENKSKIKKLREMLKSHHLSPSTQIHSRRQNNSKNFTKLIPVRNALLELGKSLSIFWVKV